MAIRATPWVLPGIRFLLLKHYAPCAFLRDHFPYVCHFTNLFLTPSRLNSSAGLHVSQTTFYFRNASRLFPASWVFLFLGLLSMCFPSSQHLVFSSRSNLTHGGHSGSRCSPLSLTFCSPSWNHGGLTIPFGSRLPCSFICIYFVSFSLNCKFLEGIGLGDCWMSEDSLSDRNVLGLE